MTVGPMCGNADGGEGEKKDKLPGEPWKPLPPPPPDGGPPPGDGKHCK
ncbi:hypothetical protein GA0115259_1020819 [Streptomyces sp. MnatMP-M17]|nr:hypothetical protein GA0115259_1020819 [Streptomyces sp. MnatMP-M17]